MDPKFAPMIDTGLITTWARERGYDQPYGSKPWLVLVLVRNQRIWLDLSATNPEIRFYNRVADIAIANCFMSIGENSIRRAFNSLLKESDIPNTLDPSLGMSEAEKLKHW